MGNFLNKDNYIGYYKNGVLHRDKDEPAVI